MKSKFNFFLAFGILGLFSIRGISQSLNNQLENVQEIELVRPGQFSELPAYIKFKKGQERDLANFESWIKTTLNLAPEMGFHLLRKEQDNLGHTHYRYQQTFNGFPLEDAIWIAHTIEDKVYSCNGLIYKNLPAKTTYILSEEEAKSKALEKINAETYKWELPSEENHLKWESSDENATYFPKGELVYVAASKKFEAGSYRLVYKFNIYAHKPLYRANVYVDANTGAIIRENLLIHHADTPGTAHTAYSGPQPIIADSFEGSYRLRDASRGDGVRTFDLNNGITYGLAVDFIDTDNDWNNINPELDEYATDAHWGTEMTYDYFLDYHDRNSIDNEGFQLNSYVHYDENFFNAFWDGERMTYGDGNGFEPSSPFTTMDIVGHEITHGLTSLTADLIYFEESGALNESFSDIFGTAIEEYAKPGDWDWLLGEEMGVTLRSMSNPNLYDCPDTYGGDLWVDGAGVHTNSGVQNHWFYLLTEGGSGTNDLGDVYNVMAIGMDDASAIAFRNLTVYLTPSSNYSDARFYSIIAAEDIFLSCTEQVFQTVNAWHAVGIGEPFSTEVVANFSAGPTSSCRLPFVVEFENESINGDDFLWNFGDGTTSTEMHPAHTYTTEGEFDVSLEVSGALCEGGTGTDIEISEELVSIVLEEICPYIFPTFGIGDVATACQGVMYDSGGELYGYGINEYATQTISPTDAITVQLNFVSFDVQGYDWGEHECYYDKLFIYDGPSEASPLIGTFCNEVDEPEIITSTGPSITLRFESEFLDGGNAGFKIEFSCQSEASISDQTTQNGISIYPNPTDNFVTIESQLSQDGTIEVRDVIGRKLFSVSLTDQFTQIDLARYEAKGLYFIHVIDDKGETLAIEKVILN
jgi:Zn-dependent metalloprotease